MHRVNLYFVIGLFDLATLQSRQICPTFANFKFNSVRVHVLTITSLHHNDII